MTAERYTPELGQAAFGGPWEQLAAPEYVKTGLALLSVALEVQLLERWEAAGEPVGGPPGSPMANSGTSMQFATFTVCAYCWCDGDAHPHGCPPNLEVPEAPGGPLIIRWYKHANRGVTMNRQLSAEEWWQVLKLCVDAVWA